MPEVACAVGRYLCECLGARELYVAAREARIEECSPKWLSSRLNKLHAMRQHIKSIVDSRLLVNTSLPTHECAVTCAWVGRHSRQSINDAFRTIRLWLPDGWAANVERVSRRKSKSIAMF